MSDDDFPRGAGDPDFFGYPGQPQEYYEDKLIANIEAKEEDSDDDED
jgi:hypothetical protein